MANLGVPIKLLHEALGHVVTCELKTGQLYRGTLLEAEDSCNISLREITVTARDGRVSQLEQVYIRGSMVRYFIVPDMLANAPMFKRVGPNAMRGRGIGTVVELPFNEPMPEEETAGLRGKVFDDNRRLRLGKNGKISGRIDVDRVHLWGFPSVFGAFVGIHGC